MLFLKSNVLQKKWSKNKCTEIYKQTDTHVRGHACMKFCTQMAPKVLWHQGRKPI